MRSYRKYNMCSRDELLGLPRSVNTAAGIDLGGRKS